MATQSEHYGELYRDLGGEFRWRRFALNGNEVAASGEGYVNKADAEQQFTEQFPEDELRDLTVEQNVGEGDAE